MRSFTVDQNNERDEEAVHLFIVCDIFFPDWFSYLYLLYYF